MKPNSTAPAFTLTELLVVVVIVAILAGLGGAGYGKAITAAKKVKEINAGRQLITAYLNYSADHDGQYMPGMDYTVKQTVRRDGSIITMAHICQRYPFRLAPYFNFDMENVLLSSTNEEAILKINNGSKSGMYEYLVSAFPSFGMNLYFVGGNVDAMGNLSYPNECVSSQAYGSSILAFATAGTTDGNIRVEGFNILTPPRVESLRWSGKNWQKNDDPSLYGNVDARYNGKAVCAFLDGSVRELSIAELRDMQLWNKNAAQQKDPNYTIQ